MNMKRLAVGQTAPEISMRDVFGTSVSFDSQKSEFTLLAFLRYSGCPWCNLTINKLSQEREKLDKNDCSIVCFIQSPKDSVIKNVHNRAKNAPLKITTIADPTLEVYEQYSIQSSKKGILASILDLPAWIRSVFWNGFTQKSIDGDLFLIPATFVVHNDTRQIVYADYGSSYYGHEDYRDIYAAIQNFRTHNK